MKTIQFRPLHANEMNLLRKMAAAGETADFPASWSDREFRVAYRYQEHRQGVEYTVALLELPTGDTLVGATKRNPTDPPNQIRGQIEALRRALASEVAFTSLDGGAE